MHSITFLNQRDHNATQILNSQSELDHNVTKVKSQSFYNTMKAKKRKDDDPIIIHQTKVKVIKESYDCKLTLLIVIIILCGITSICSSVVYSLLPTLPLEYNYILQNWNVSPITSIYLSNQCNETLINYQFEGVNAGCDCTNSSLSTNLKVVQVGQCSTYQLQEGCSTINPISAQLLQSLPFNSGIQKVCINRLNNFNYRQSDCTQQSTQVDVCGDISTEANSLFAFCVPKGQSCPLKSISTSVIDSTYSQVGSLSLYTSTNGYKTPNFIQAYLSQGDGICSDYNSQQYSTSQGFDYPLFVRSKNMCDSSILDSRFKKIISFSEDSFMTSSGLASQFKNLPDYSYNSNSNLYYLMQQNQIPWKQIGNCRSTHMNTFLNIQYSLNKINVFWLISIILHYSMLFFKGFLLICLLTGVAIIKSKRILLIAFLLILLFLQFLMKFITFILTIISHTELSSMNDAFCSDSQTNNLIGNFFNSFKKGYFIVEVLLFILVCIIVILTLQFVRSLLKKENQQIKEEEQSNIMIDEKITSRQIIESEKVIKNNQLVYTAQFQSIPLANLEKRKILHRSNSDFQGRLFSMGDEFIKEIHNIRLKNEQAYLNRLAHYNKGKSYLSKMELNVDSDSLEYNYFNRINSQQSRDLLTKYSYKNNKTIPQERIKHISLTNFSPFIKYSISEREKIRLNNRKNLKQVIAYKRSNSGECIKNSSSLFNPLERSLLRQKKHQIQINLRRKCEQTLKNQNQPNSIKPLKIRQDDKYETNNLNQSNFPLDIQETKQVSKEPNGQNPEDDNIIRNINSLISILNEDTQPILSDKQKSQNSTTDKNLHLQLKNDETKEYKSCLDSIQNLIDGEQNKIPSYNTINKDNSKQIYSTNIIQYNIQNYLNKSLINKSPDQIQQKDDINHRLKFHKTHQNLDDIEKLLFIDTQNRNNKENKQIPNNHQQTDSQDILSNTPSTTQEIIQTPSPNEQLNSQQKQELFALEKRKPEQKDNTKDKAKKQPIENKIITKNLSTIEDNPKDKISPKQINQNQYKKSQTLITPQKPLRNSLLIASINKPKSKQVRSAIQLDDMQIQSLEFLENEGEEGSSTEKLDNQMNYDRMKFYKRNVKVPRFVVPNFNVVKPRYLEQSPYSYTKPESKVFSSKKSKIRLPLSKSESQNDILSFHNIDSADSNIKSIILCLNGQNKDNQNSPVKQTDLHQGKHLLSDLGQNRSTIKNNSNKDQNNYYSDLTLNYKNQIDQQISNLSSQFTNRFTDSTDKNKQHKINNSNNHTQNNNEKQIEQNKSKQQSNEKQYYDLNLSDETVNRLNQHRINNLNQILEQYSTYVPAFLEDKSQPNEYMNSHSQINKQQAVNNINSNNNNLLQKSKTRQSQQKLKFISLPSPSKLNVNGLYQSNQDNDQNVYLN